MPEYLSPGVYVEEVEIGAKPIEGVSTSTAGFIGLTERGTEKPTLVTGFDDFQRKFGTYIEGSYLAYALDGFFKNGGQRCFISRIIKDANTSAKASLTRNDVTFETIGRGAWGNSVAVRIDDASLRGIVTNLFKLTVIFWSSNILQASDLVPSAVGDPISAQVEKLKSRNGVVVEEYDNLSIDPQSPDYFVKKVTDLSNLIAVKYTGAAPAVPPNTGPPTTANVLFETLTGGTNGAGSLSPTDFVGANTKGSRTGLHAFEEIEEISILYIPDVHMLNDQDSDSTVKEAITHCETLKSRVVIIDAKLGSQDISTLSPPSPTSKYAAFYYPWIQAYDPLSKRQKMLPPGGFIAGIYARSDTERGVHKAPANEVVKNATGVEFTVTKPEQDMLNPRGVNCIRVFQGKGIVLWGARTTIRDPLWKYVNVR